MPSKKKAAFDNILGVSDGSANFEERMQSGAPSKTEGPERLELDRLKIAIERRQLEDWERRLEAQRKQQEAWQKEIGRRIENTNNELQERDEAMKREIEVYRGRRTPVTDMFLTTTTCTMSLAAFVGAFLDAMFNSLPYASPEMWLGSALILIGLAVGTSRKRNAESEPNPPD